MAQRHGTAARRTTTRSRPLVLSALLIGALATATGCGTDSGAGAWTRSDTSGAAHTSDAADSSDTSRASDSSDASQGAAAPRDHSAPSRARSATDSAAAPAVRRICSTQALKLTVGRKDVGAGNVYLPLVLTNTSTSACTLTGFPGVSLLDADGALIGAPAVRRGPSHSTVSLPPGGRASAVLHTLNEGVSDTPCWKPAAAIRAYPPDSLRAMKTAAHSFRVCGGVFDVEAVRSGAGT
ncbi:DUF4232 domain-containing protein [Streptomyces coffeae]|uniref:DUF4232 domain-containing protein n=1 Tax=Streptomyces coffeae TaxID=621382 RepID=A0ABS1NFU7_9ACTN|nr:DUF4232 domain-containing protein [Streptomyces coffeae]MBL1098770.1 DUF4232 domain-containing protein [Streptomyces coffeae]